MLRLSLELLSVVLNRRRVVPLYTWVDARRFTESQDRLISVSGSVSTTSILQYKLHTKSRFTAAGLKTVLGLTQHPHLSSWASSITNY